MKRAKVVGASATNENYSLLFFKKYYLLFLFVSHLEFPGYSCGSMLLLFARFHSRFGYLKNFFIKRFFSFLALVLMNLERFIT